MISQLTGKRHVRDIDITEDQFDLVKDPNGPHIQTIVPHLFRDDREYLITGTTPEEWDTLIGDE